MEQCENVSGGATEAAEREVEYHDNDVSTEDGVFAAEDCVASQPARVDKGTQTPVVPTVPIKDQCERKRRKMRAEAIDTFKDTTMKYVCFVNDNVPEFVRDTVNSKKCDSAFGLSGKFGDAALNPTLKALTKEYKDSRSKEKLRETRRRLSNLKGEICIGNTLNDSRISMTDEKNGNQFKNRTGAAKSIDRLTTGADERRRLLSIVVSDYP